MYEQWRLIKLFCCNVLFYTVVRRHSFLSSENYNFGIGIAVIAKKKKSCQEDENVFFLDSEQRKVFES